MFRLALFVLGGLVTFFIAAAQWQSLPPLYASIGEAGARLPSSQPAACTEGDFGGRPARPAGISASFKDGSVLLQWTTCSGILDRYEIKRGGSRDINAGAKTIADKVSRDDETFVDKDVKPGETYYYWVIAYAGKANSYLTEPAAIVAPLPPPSPEELRLIPDVLRVQASLVEIFVAKSIGDDIMAGRYAPPAVTPTPVPAPGYSPALGPGGVAGGASDLSPNSAPGLQPSAERAEQMRAVWEALAAQVVALEKVEDEREAVGILSTFAYLGEALQWGTALSNTAELVANGTISNEEGKRLWSLIPGEPPPTGIVLTAAAFVELLEKSAEETYSATRTGDQAVGAQDKEQMRRVAARLQTQGQWLENQLGSESQAEQGACPREGGCYPDLIEIAREAASASLEFVAGKPDAKNRWAWASKQTAQAIAAGGRPMGGGGGAQAEPPWFRPMADYCEALGGKVTRYNGFAFTCRWTSKTTIFPCQYLVNNAGQVTPDSAPMCAASAPASFAGAVPGEPTWYRTALEDCKIRPGMLTYFTGFAFGCRWLGGPPPNPCIYYVDSEGTVTSNDPSPECRLAMPRSYGAVATPPATANPPLFRVSAPPLPAQLGKVYSHWFCESSVRTTLLCGSLIPAAVNNPTGGVQPYTFERQVLSGNLPSGLKLSFGGELHGTPTSAGDAGKTFDFKICAVDQLRNSSCQTVQLTVEAREASPTPTQTPGAEQNWKFQGVYKGTKTGTCRNVAGTQPYSDVFEAKVIGNQLWILAGGSIRFGPDAIDPFGGVRVVETGRSYKITYDLKFAADSASSPASVQGTYEYVNTGTAAGCSATISAKRV